MTTTIEGHRIVAINAVFCPRECKGPEDTIRFLGSSEGRYARFVFLHELAHHLFHDNHPDRPASWAHSPPQGERIWTIQKEVEADFYALLAMVSDGAIIDDYARFKKRRRVIYAVARRLGYMHALDHDHRRRIRDLATYRLRLFEAFCGAFRLVSAAPFDEWPGRQYREVRTLDAVQAQRSHQSHNLGDLSKILVWHPSVHPDDAKQLQALGSLPFDYVTDEPQPPTSLTYRLDREQLLRCAGLSPSSDTAHCGQF